MIKLAIITTHPIQYNAPLFRLLAERKIVNIKVFYTWGAGVLIKKHDPGFNKIIEWDIPLLDGYEYEFVENVSTNPGSSHFSGIDNPSLKKTVEQWRPTVILVYGWSFKSHLACMRHFKNRLPVFFRGDSTLLDEQAGIKQIIRRAFLKWVYQHVDQAMYVGIQNKQYFLKHGLKDNQLFFGPHVIDNRYFEKNYDSLTQARQLRSRLGIPTNDIVFLFAGKLEAKKNPGLLMDAFKRINTVATHLVIAGDGVMGKELKSAAAGHYNIHFLPFQNQSMMPGLYQMSDVFVLPSKGPGETWGLAINEAMAASKPVLVSNACGAAEDLIITGKNGYVFNSTDLEDLSEKLKIFLERRNELGAMGVYSERMIQSWSLERLCSALETRLISNY